jgi:hypothetical protein
MDVSRFGSGPFLRPGLCASTAPRAAVVKTGQRPPPEAARRGLDEREHGARLNQVGHCRREVSHQSPPIRCGGGWRTHVGFPLLTGRKSHHHDPRGPITQTDGLQTKAEITAGNAPVAL